MAAKPMIWVFVSVFCTMIPMPVVLFAGLLILQQGGLTVIAQGADDVALFLDQKELEVKWIAGNVTLNDGDCGSLASCKAECSRATCHPLSGESRQCISIDNSKLYNTCPSEDGCRDMMFVDYIKSYVTLPASASTTSLQTEIARDICLQRRLDSTFKTISIPLKHSEVFFGSASGAFRSFPGREKSETQCTSYDPRWRPWYLNGISVSRDVKILVDVAKSMDQPLTIEYNRPPGATYLDVAKNMTVTLLQTFSPGDNVEVFPFNETNATSLGGAFAVINPYGYLNLNPELAALVTNVNVLAASSTAGASDLNGAIRRAASSFNQIQSLKIIIVLSNGLFVVNSTTFPSAALLSNRAKLMVYKLPTNDDGGDMFLQRTSFQKDICSVQGSFELLDALATLNPLYSMRSYFTYLAGIQLSGAGGNVTWTAVPSSSFQNYDVVISTYPAFGRDGLLIGVAGVHVIVDKMFATPTLLLQDLSRRISVTRSPPANISMTCYYQTNTGLANWSCSPLNSCSICRQNDTSSTLAQRTCCRTCGAYGLQRPTQKQPWFISVIGIVIGFLLTIIPVVVRCICEMMGLRNLWWEPDDEDDIYLNLCECIVNNIEKHRSMQNLLNERQCLDLSTKLSRTIRNIRKIIFCCGASANFFKPVLEKLYLDLTKAKLLVIQCGKEDWCRASVFQIHNELAFQEILLDVGLCYNVIYEQARSLGLERNLPEDLRQSSVFTPASKDDVHEDQSKLKKRLGALASGYRVSGRVSLKQCLARYLVERFNHPSDANTLDTCSPILWAKENVPTGIWGNSCNLESGSGASCVCKTKWMGIPCVKKEFHVRGSEQFFLKEASISAHFKHPCVVNFICCGNGMLKGDRFIAMERLEKSLFDLIEAQDDEPFPLPVVVDIMVQIARGMCYLHGQRVAHRDLKPPNVVVNTLTSPDENYYCVKLVDFGMSKTKVEVMKYNIISSPGVGTTTYRAPEVHRDGEGRANWFKADVWSFAMTCAHMLSLTIPFIDIEWSKLHIHLKDGERPKLPRNCPPELNILLKDCWATNPRLRPTFVEIFKRLEALRFKILTRHSTYQPRLQGKSDEYIKEKIIEYDNTFSQRHLDANHGVVRENEATNAIEEETKDMMIILDLPTRGIIAPHTSIEMTQKNSRHLRRSSF